MKRGKNFKSNNVKEALLGIIIGIVLLMFLVFGSKLIYEKPEYESYCYPNKYIQEEGKINDSLQIQYEECSNKYMQAQEKYSKKMFVLSLIAGIVLILGSVVFIEVSSVSGGIMLGSLMFIIYGTGNYWRFMNDWGRFVILGLSLLILIYMGYWLNKDKKNGRKKKR